MRIDRIELATETDKVELRFHPRLTLVSGLGRLEREALSNEVLGAIGAGRAGLSVDMVADNGRCLEVQRPLTGPATVRDAVNCEDLTDRFLNGETVDVLRTLGLSRSKARELLHFGVRNLQSTDDLDSTVARLAAIDQETLWSTAIQMAEIELEIAAILEEEPVNDPLALTAERIEHVHAERDMAADEMDKARSQSVVGSIALVLIGIAVALITHPLLSIPFILGAAGMAFRAWQKAREYEEAVMAEDAVLSEAGIGSYLNFQLKKVDELTSNKVVRTRALELAELQRMTTDGWEAIVGQGVTLEWAAAHRDQIAAAADRIAGGGSTGYSKGHPTECLARSFVAARGAVGETIPMLVDEPFLSLDDAELLDVQNALTTYAPHIQFVIMSSDPRMLRWAKEQAAKQTAAIIPLGQPASEPEPEPSVNPPQTEGDPTSQAPGDPARHMDPSVVRSVDRLERKYGDKSDTAAVQAVT